VPESLIGRLTFRIFRTFGLWGRVPDISTMPNFNSIGSGVSEPQVAKNHYLPLTRGIALTTVYALTCHTVTIMRQYETRVVVINRWMAPVYLEAAAVVCSGVSVVSRVPPRPTLMYSVPYRSLEASSLQVVCCHVCHVSHILTEILVCSVCMCSEVMVLEY